MIENLEKSSIYLMNVDSFNGETQSSVARLSPAGRTVRAETGEKTLSSCKKLYHCFLCTHISLYLVYWLAWQKFLCYHEDYFTEDLINFTARWNLICIQFLHHFGEIHKWRKNMVSMATMFKLLKRYTYPAMTVQQR